MMNRKDYMMYNRSAIYVYAREHIERHFRKCILPAHLSALATPQVSYVPSPLVLPVLLSSFVCFLSLKYTEIEREVTYIHEFIVAALVHCRHHHTLDSWLTKKATQNNANIMEKYCIRSRYMCIYMK